MTPSATTYLGHKIMINRRSLLGWLSGLLAAPKAEAVVDTPPAPPAPPDPSVRVVVFPIYRCETFNMGYGKVVYWDSLMRTVRGEDRTRKPGLRRWDGGLSTPEFITQRLDESKFTPHTLVLPGGELVDVRP